MKEGDNVVSKGDVWRNKGSIGTVIAYKNATSVLVKWKTPANSSYLSSSLYHREADLTILKDDIVDPNIAFMLR